jgi:hypothetical protein
MFKNEIAQNFRLIYFSESGSSAQEFPRLYEIYPCNPKINKTVPVNVCKNLNSKMAERTRQTYLRLYKFFDEQATQRNWTWFMVFGTLLGSWRHHDVIPWDQDMDMMVEYKHRQDIVNTIEKQERFVPKQCTHHKIRIYDKDNVMGSIRDYDVGRWYTPSIDIFFFNRSSTRIYRSDYPKSNTYIFKLSDVFPLHRRPLATMMLPAPKNTVRHLLKYYGVADVCKYWGTPKCSEFKPYLPFVHRKWENGKMVESLKLNGKELQVKYVDEMKQNTPLDAYTLATIGKRH